MSETEIQEPGTEVEAVLLSTEAKLAKGEVVSFEKLLELLQPKTALEVHTPPPPPALLLTSEQRDALDRVAEVFGRVAPDTRRELEPVEIAALIEERMVLDEIKGMAEKRQADIRTIVYHHFDTAYEQDDIEGNIRRAAGRVEPERDKDGFYIHADEARVPGAPKVFKRETREYKPSLDAEILKAMDADGSLDHEDFLAMTRQVRVVDENRFMDRLRTKPSLVKVISRAIRPGSRGTALFLRKA
jgi:hypothetical protein